MTHATQGEVEARGRAEPELRRELESASDSLVRALLLHELGVAADARGEEALAARELLGAHNAAPDLREPPEALARLLARRGSKANLAKLYDALARAAVDEAGRAAILRRRAELELDADHPAQRPSPAALEAALALLEQATDLAPDDLTAWVELELVGHALANEAVVERALAAQIDRASSPELRATLELDLARAAARSGDAVRALELALPVLAGGLSARFGAAQLVEALSRRVGDEDGLVRSLELQRTWALEAARSPERGDELGVPPHARRSPFLVDLLVRLATLHRERGNFEEAEGRLVEAATLAPDARWLDRSRSELVEAGGRIEAASELASTLLERGAHGVEGGALWLRVAASARAEGSIERELEALERAIELDPSSLLAVAMRLERLADGRDPHALVESLRALAARFTRPAAKARCLALVAFVHATLAHDGTAARGALAEAAALGFDDRGRLSTLLAILTGGVGDSASNDGSEGDAELPPEAMFGVLRAAVVGRDAEGLRAALGRADRGNDDSRWLARALRFAGHALDPKLREAIESPRHAVVDAVAATEPDPLAARGFRLVAALRALESDDRTAGLASLRALFDDMPSDELAGLALAEVLRDDDVAAAEVASRLAGATIDGELGGTLRVEAALRRLRAGERAEAAAEFERASELLPALSGVVLTWGPRLVPPRSVEERRARLEVDSGSSAAAQALERLGLELAAAERGALRSAGDALDALEFAVLDGGAVGSDGGLDELLEIETIAALFRVVWPDESAESQVARALDTLDSRGRAGARIAATVRLARARDRGDDPGLAVVEAKRAFEVDASPAAAIEWLGAAVAANDRAAELEALGSLDRRVELGGGLRSMAALTELLDHALVGVETARVAPLVGGTAADRLANVELALAGGEVARRADALDALGDEVGAEARVDASLLAGFERLAARDGAAALACFERVVAVRPNDLAAWEGLRSAACALERPRDEARACEQLGALCLDDARAAAFLERAGLLLVDVVDEAARGELLLGRALARAPQRAAAFDRVFRLLRDRKDEAGLLALIERRRPYIVDPAERTRLAWERARSLQALGDGAAALDALVEVRSAEPDHLGALALAGTIHLQRGEFERAARELAALARSDAAPKQERLVSGTTAADLFENKLASPAEAVAVLRALNVAGIGTTAVRERLVRAAARAGEWREATAMLERLMAERDSIAGRLEAARLALAIWRDKLREPTGAKSAVELLLEARPDDPEAVALVLHTNFEAAFRATALRRARERLLNALNDEPADLERTGLLVRVAEALGDRELRAALLGALPSFGRSDPRIVAELDAAQADMPMAPSGTMEPRAMSVLVDPEEHPAFARLVSAVAETLSAVLSPSLEALGLGRRHRVDPRTGGAGTAHAAAWAAWAGFSEIDLYVGGTNPKAVIGLRDGDTPVLVLGAEVARGLDRVTRGALAREVVALHRGTSALAGADDARFAAALVEILRELDEAVPTPLAPPSAHPDQATLAKAVRKEISRRVKKAAAEPARALVASTGASLLGLAAAARRTLDRATLLGAGALHTVIESMAPSTAPGAALRADDRARSLARFALSSQYLGLRRELGLGVK
jgi:hypothetical protein